MTKSDFEALLKPALDRIANHRLDASLERYLNEIFPVEGDYCQSILAACKQGDADRWICEREAAGIRYGRIIKPSPATNGFSVDVVQMGRITGPHHAHPNGEIDLVLPTEGRPTFDDRPAGWLVYGPGSAHKPTVENGCAYIMYLLPGGAIDFARI
jgi:Domain of unknown function (DUF4863)